MYILYTIYSFIYLCHLFSCKVAHINQTRNIYNKCNLYQTTNFENLKTHENGTTTLILNVRNHIPSDKAAHPSRIDTSSIPMQKP